MLILPSMGCVRHDCHNLCCKIAFLVCLRQLSALEFLPSIMPSALLPAKPRFKQIQRNTKENNLVLVAI